MDRSPGKTETRSFGRFVAPLVLFGGFGAVLLGCPVYGSDRAYRVCTDDACFQCTTTTLTSDCLVWSCDYDSDCPSNARCSQALCVFTPAPMADAGVDAGPKPDGGPVPVPPPDASVDAGPAPVSCFADGDCTKATGAGSKCLSGTCTALADQCTDARHCSDSQHCIEGRCATLCNPADASPCAASYACTAVPGAASGTAACTPKGAACGLNGPSCFGNTTCFEGQCLPGCATTADCKGGAASAGLACIKGACVLDERPHFGCAASAEGGKCAAGSTGAVCIRRACYADCSGASCAPSDSCTTRSYSGKGTVSFCEPNGAFGNECSPGKSCLTGVCFDGACK